MLQKWKFQLSNTNITCNASLLNRTFLFWSYKCPQNHMLWKKKQLFIIIKFPNIFTFTPLPSVVTNPSQQPRVPWMFIITGTDVDYSGCSPRWWRGRISPLTRRLIKYKNFRKKKKKKEGHYVRVPHYFFKPTLVWDPLRRPIPLYDFGRKWTVRSHEPLQSVDARPNQLASVVLLSAQTSSFLTFYYWGIYGISST